MRQVALYGGAFDPPHKSHIQIVKSLIRIPFIDQVWLLPSGERDDKKLLLRADTRFNLIKAIFKN